MTKRFLVNPFEEAERQVLERGDWVVATVDPQMSWPATRQVVAFEGKDFVIFPQSGDADRTAAIGLRVDKYGLSSGSARSEIMRFCSSLAWKMAGGLSVIAWGGGNLPRPVGVRRGRVITNFLEAEPLPVAKSDEERTALALYREGISLDNPFYAFLSLYKVIGVLLPQGKKRGAWISDALSRLDHERARVRCNEIKSQHADVGLYLRDECRNAVAHADRRPFVNPDEVDDHFRLSRDLPLLRNLAELAIEEMSSIQRGHTLWREHLYELAGFKEFFSQDILDLIKGSEPVPDGTSIDLPEIYTVLARRGAEVISFLSMKPQIIDQVEGGLVFDFVTADDMVRVRTILSFADERLVFDPQQGIGFTPNRDDAKYIKYEIDMLRFVRCVLGNGHIEIWDQEREVMLGRSETYIPLNSFINSEFFEFELAELEKLLESNRKVN